MSRSTIQHLRVGYDGEMSPLLGLKGQGWEWYPLPETEKKVWEDPQQDQQPLVMGPPQQKATNTQLPLSSSRLLGYLYLIYSAEGRR